LKRTYIPELDANDTLSIDSDIPPPKISRVSRDVAIVNGSQDIGVNNNVAAENVCSCGVGSDVAIASQYQSL
jgi:hypothetical protein